MTVAWGIKPNGSLLASFPQHFPTWPLLNGLRAPVSFWLSDTNSSFWGPANLVGGLGHG